MAAATAARSSANGCSTTLHFHARDSATARKIRPDHLIFFRDEDEALKMGFRAATR